MVGSITSSTGTKSIVKSVLFCAVFTILLVILSVVKGFLPHEFERIAHGATGTVAALFATFLFLKFDKKRFADIGLKWEKGTPVKFLAGVITGIVLMGLLAAFVLHFSAVKIEVNPASNVFHFLLVTAPLLPLAFMEELAFRAYPLQQLRNNVGIRMSVFITSLLFALYHIANGWSIASSFYGPAVWGLIFGLAALYSRGIALPTGIHYAANLTTSAFGEKNTTASIWTVTPSGDPTVPQGGIDWLTVLPPVALLVIGLVCMEWYTRRKAAVGKAYEKAGPLVIDQNL